MQKAHAHLRALNLSTALSDSDKEKIRPVLKASFMLLDESDSDINNTVRSQPGESSDSDDDNLQPELQRKRLIKHRLPWRSRELQLTIESLDRKIGGGVPIEQSLCALISYLEVIPPDQLQNSPEWAIELFS